MLFEIIRSDIDADKKKYAERCERNRENISKRWNTTEYERIRSNTNDTKHTDRIGKDKDKEEDKDIYKGIYTRTRARTKFSNFDERSYDYKALEGGTL